MIFQHSITKRCVVSFYLSMILAVSQVVPGQAQGPVDMAQEVFKGKVLIPGGESNPYPEDTVVWPDYTDDGLTPPPKEARRPGFPEAPGQAIGQSGPVIIQGRSKRDIVIGIFAPDGRAIAFFSRNEAEEQPQTIDLALNLAHDIGRALLLRTGAKRLAMTIPEGWTLPASPKGEVPVGRLAKGKKDTSLKFQYTSEGAMSGGEVRVSVPEGWETPGSKPGKDQMARVGQKDGIEILSTPPEVRVDSVPDGSGQVRTSDGWSPPQASPGSAGYATPGSSTQTVPIGRLGKGEKVTIEYQPEGVMSGGVVRVSVPKGWTQPQPPKDWVPETAVVLRQGIPPAHRTIIRKLIVVALIKNKRGEKFLQIFRDSIYVYLGEKVFIRRIQTDPNDPLYAKGSGGKSGSSSKKKGGLGISFGIGGGFGGGFGGVTIGGGKKGGPRIVDQWGLQRVGFTPKGEGSSAWDVYDGRQRNVTVAVIDSGLDRTHPDGPMYVWTNEDEIPDNGIDDDGNGYVDDRHGYNFVEENTDLDDVNGHGTFIAGIIAAATNNGRGIAGINPGAVIMPVKVVNDKGVSSSLDIWRGIHYAVDNGARVINLSLGESGLSQLEQLAVNYAVSSGVPVVVASGNAGEQMTDYGPAGVRRALVVGAIDYDGKVSVISNRGPNLALVAPGEEIYSLHSQKAEWEGPAMDRERLYTKKSGTSFAAPFVTGTVSLLLARHPDLTPDNIENILIGTAKDRPPSGWDGESGAGLLDAPSVLSADSKTPFLWVRPIEVQVIRERKRPSQIVLYAKAGRPAKQYTLEIAPSEKAKKWTTLVASSDIPGDYSVWAVVDDKKVLRWRSIAWRLTVTDDMDRQAQAVWTTQLK